MGVSVGLPVFYPLSVVPGLSGKTPPSRDLVFCQAPPVKLQFFFKLSLPATRRTTGAMMNDTNPNNARCSVTYHSKVP